MRYLLLVGVALVGLTNNAKADYNPLTGLFTSGAAPLSAKDLNSALGMRQPLNGDVDTQNITLNGLRQTLGNAFAANASIKPTMAALRATVPTVDGVVAYLTGYSTPNDSGGGFFTWSAASNASDDGGSVINPPNHVGAGRWLRLLDKPGVVYPAMFGAVGDAVTDDSAAVVAADAAATAHGWQLTIYRPNYLRTGITLNSRVAFAPGSRFKWDGTTTVALNGGVVAGANQQIFDYPVTATLNLGVEQTVSLDWLYGPTDGTVDVSKYGNDLINSAPTNGRDIKHNYGRWLLASPLNIGTHNFIHITGPGQAWRSNIEYQKAAPAGVGAVAQYPGGGAALLLAPNVTAAVLVPSYGIANYRVSGLSITGLTLIGSGSATTTNNGIAINDATDRTEISNNALINFSLGIYVSYADVLTISNNIIAETTYSVKVTQSFRANISNNYLGATPAGITLDVENSDTVSVVNNHIFPDGQVAVNYVADSHLYSIGNIIESRFTGAVLITNTNVSKFSDTVRVYNFLASNPATDWTTGKTWSQPAYDPAGRDLQYGVVRVQGSNDNDLSGYKIDNQTPANSALFRNVSGDRNWYNVIQTSGNGSTSKIVVDSGSDVQVVNSVVAAEYVKNGGTVNFVPHVVGQ